MDENKELLANIVACTQRPEGECRRALLDAAGNVEQAVAMLLSATLAEGGAAQGVRPQVGGGSAAGSSSDGPVVAGPSVLGVAQRRGGAEACGPDAAAPSVADGASSSSKRKGKRPRPPENGDRLWIWWPKDQRWYAGVVMGKMGEVGGDTQDETLVLYDDDEYDNGPCTEDLCELVSQRHVVWWRSATPPPPPDEE
jgi:hypothetical protein